MDLTIPINGIKLNIRVTLLVETPNGFIFEKDKSGFFFPVGGRIKINESSIDAAKREIKEELGIEIEEPTYIATLENFFHYEGKPFHEISIIYQAKIEEFDCPNGFYAFDSERMKNLDIKPAAINEIISNKSSGIKHFIIRENEKGTEHPCPSLLKTGVN